MARGFVGLTADLTTKDRYFVVNTRSESAERLLTHQNRGWEHLITPGSNTIARLRNDFRTSFKHFKARGH